jgi:hypothetical protein
MSEVEGQADRLKLTLAVLAASFISSAMSLIGPEQTLQSATAAAAFGGKNSPASSAYL